MKKDIEEEDKKTPLAIRWSFYLDLLSETKMASLFMEWYGNNIIMYNNPLYTYYNDRWFDESSEFKVWLYISEDFHDKCYEKIINDEILKGAARDNVIDRLRSMTSKKTNIACLISHIKANASVAKEDIFNIKNPHLLGFENGVYDLEKGELRPYKYDDYITLSTKYDYIKPDYVNNGIDKNMRDEILAIFKTIHPDQEIRDLCMQILASGLDGKNYQN